MMFGEEMNLELPKDGYMISVAKYVRWQHSSLLTSNLCRDFCIIIITIIIIIITIIIIIIIIIIILAFRATVARCTSSTPKSS